jgi:small subunit ribosomal protein S11
MKKQQKKEISNKHINKKYKICKLYVKKTLNNTFVTLTNIKGDTLTYYSTGKLGFKGAKKASSYATDSIFLQIVKDCLSMGIKSISLYYNITGNHLKKFVKILRTNRIKIKSITNNIPVTFNGCRKPKVRRI